MALCAATHNVASVEHLLAEMRRLGITAGGTQAPRVSCAQLLGMADNITFPLARAGVPVLKYLPYGSVREVFPYLVRRAEENESVLQQSSGELARVRAELARRAADR